jgi:tryptophan-rich sensory protein
VEAARARGPLWRPVATAALVAVATAALGGTLTDIGPWYQSLRQPAWKPPDALFGPAWTLIYGFTVASAVIGWRRAPDRKAREWLIGLFALNGFLNVLWSLLFFRLQRPDWALVEVVALWLSIALLMLVLRRYARISSLLLVPYLAWVSFAAALNAAVVRLNGPFS